MGYGLAMEWKIEPGLTDYQHALEVMAARVKAIQQGAAEELVWLVEHPPLYTLGTSAKAGDVLSHQGIPVYPTGRGGQVTYHGPGQRVVYLMLDLKKRAQTRGEAPDLRRYVQQLEQWVIDALLQFGVTGYLREGRVGVWVDTHAGEAKIAALGVRVQQWVTSHGVAINLNPDLSHYAGIVPCGIREFGVTSLAALGAEATMAQLDDTLKQCFVTMFA